MSNKAAIWQLRAPGLSTLRRVASPWQRPTAAVARDPAGDQRLWRVVIHNSIHELDAQRWDSLSGAGAVLRSHAYLAAIEDAGIASCRYYYPVVHDQHDAVIAQCCVYVVSTDFAQLLPPSLQRAVSVLRRLWPGFLTARIVECATPLFAGSSLTTDHSSHRAGAVAAIERAMRDIAVRERSSLLVLRDFFAGECEDLDFLIARGYKRVANLPLARLRVRWNSYADYLASLRARYRKDIKRRLRRSEAAGRRVEILHDFGHDAASWSRQVNAIYANARGFKREKINPAYYVNMNGLPDAASVLLVVRHEQRYIAHGMVIFDRDNTIATFFGREPGPAGGEWFLLMNEVIRIGIERGSKYISLGLGSYEAKSLVGADIEPLFVYTRATNRVLNALIKLVPDLMRHERTAGRRLFKSEPDGGNDVH